jgi:alkanesulfonate monooxygenase
VDSFLIRGFEPLNDAVEFGRELIPRVKSGAVSIDDVKAAE